MWYHYDMASLLNNVEVLHMTKPKYRIDEPRMAKCVASLAIIYIKADMLNALQDLHKRSKHLPIWDNDLALNAVYNSRLTILKWFAQLLGTIEVGTTTFDLLAASGNLPLVIWLTENTAT